MPKKGQELIEMRKLTPKQLERAKKLISEGETIKEIARLYGVTPGYFHYYGIRKNKRPLLDWNDKKAVAEYHKIYKKTKGKEWKEERNNKQKEYYYKNKEEIRKREKERYWENRMEIHKRRMEQRRNELQVKINSKREYILNK